MLNTNTIIPNTNTTSATNDLIVYFIKLIPIPTNNTKFTIKRP